MINAVELHAWLEKLEQRLTDEGVQKVRLLLNEWAVNDRPLTDAEVEEAALMLDAIVRKHSKWGGA